MSAPSPVENDASAQSPASREARSGRRRWLPIVAGLSAAGAISVGLLNVLGVSTGPVVNLVAVLLLVGAFIGSMTQILRENFRDYTRQKKWLFVAAVVVVATALVLLGFATRPTTPLHRMPGTQDIAVVGFHPSNAEGQQAWEGLGASVASALAKPRGGEIYDFSEDVDPPLDRLESSASDGQLSAWANDFVGQTGAELVIGGWEEGPPETPSIEIAAYVPAELVPDAVELSGWTALVRIPIDSSLSSTTARKEFTDDLEAHVGALSTFTTALDEWHEGHSAAAAGDFHAVQLHNPEESKTLVGLAHLLRGHALESEAAVSPVASKRTLLDEARSEYQAARSTAGLGRRVDLSIATNAYLIQSLPDCNARPGLLDTLSAISDRLAAIAGPAPDDLVSLRAWANLGQVQLCRAVAGAGDAYRIAEPILARLTALQPFNNVTQRAADQIRSLAYSTKATLLGERGQYAPAVSAIEQAIELDTRFERRALWLGLESSWLLQECKQPEGLAAQEQSLAQLGNAIRRLRVPQSELPVFEKEFATERAAAQSRCSRSR